MQQQLEQYLVQFDRSNIQKLSVGFNNMLVLDNIQVKHDLLYRYDIPIVIQHSRIGRISIQIPIQITKSPVKIIIENVDINMTGSSETEANSVYSTHG